MPGKRLIIDLTTGRCACGCGQEVAHRFRQGHDQRLRGALMRAHIADQQVTVRQGRERRSLSALVAASLLDHDSCSWSSRLRDR